MKRRDDISLDDVRALRPRLRPSGDEWVDSERGRKVLERVLASDRSAAARDSAQQRSGWTWGPRLAFAAGAAVIVALAVVLTVVVLAKDGVEEPRVASTETSVEATQHVSTYEAVAGIMPMYKHLMGHDTAPLTNGHTVLDQAASLGLIPREAASGDAASSPMTQGEYALVLAKAFGWLLGSPSLSPDPADTAGEVEAIDLLRAAGIILPEDGDFVAAQPLTKPVEEKLVARLQGALKYQTD